MGFDTTTHITIVYSCENLMPFFMIIYNMLTSIVVVVEPIAIVTFTLGVFGCLASYEKDVLRVFKSKNTFV